MKIHTLIVALVTGCSNAGPMPDDWGDTQRFTEELSFKEHCGITLADRTFGSDADVTTSRSYGTTDCHLAFVVDVLDYQFIDEAGTAGLFLEWADASPLSPSIC